MDTKRPLLGLLSLLSLLGLLTMPTATLAYVTPEQVLFQTEYDFYIPPEEEEEDANVRKQKSQGPPLRTTYKPYSQMTEEERKGVVKKKETDEETPSRSAPSSTAGQAEEAMEEGEEEFVTLDPRSVRLLERIERMRSRAFQETRESDLAPTGAATTGAMLMLAVAGLWTLRRARKFERFF